MPELPEMERYRIVLSDHILHQPITHIEVTREKSINMPVKEFLNKVQGQHIIEISRRAKYLILSLNTGMQLLLHLMLGGWMYIGSAQDSPSRTKQITLSFGKKQLFFIGLRLGYLHLLTQSELEQRLTGLGPEPFDQSFSLKSFEAKLGKRSVSLKALLVDQKFIAGIGNCYVDEICYKAKLHPGRKANKLTEEEIVNLYNAIRPVLSRALDIGGYMDNPIYHDDYKTGAYNHHFLVYELDGAPCPNCGTTIQRIEVSGRKSFICPTCQGQSEA